MISSSRKYAKAIVGVLLCLQVVLLANSARRISPTFEEVSYLPAGLSHWDFGTFELHRADPPLVRLTASLGALPAGPEREWMSFVRMPGARVEILVGRDFVEKNGTHSFWLFTLARWACIPFSLIGSFVCYLWAKQLYGEVAGVVSLLIWIFAPEVFAQGSLITPDIAGVSTCMLALHGFWLWLRRRTASSAILFGVLLGFATITTMKGMLLFVLCPLLWAVWTICRGTSHSIRPRVDSGIHRVLASPAMQVAIMILSVVVVINSGYAFSGTCAALGSYKFTSESLSGERRLRLGQWGNIASGTWMETIAIPLPTDFVLGIDESIRAVEGMPDTAHSVNVRRCLNGICSRLPTPMLILFLLAIFRGSSPAQDRWAEHRSQPGPMEKQHEAGLSRSIGHSGAMLWLDEMVVAAPIVGLLAVVFLSPGLFRNEPLALWILPVGCIWSARLFSSEMPSPSNGQVPLAGSQQSRSTDRPASSGTTQYGRLHERIAGLLDVRIRCRYGEVLQGMGFLALASNIVVGLIAYPAAMAYTNVFSHSPGMCASRLDRGQDCMLLRDWLERHPEAQPFGLAYHGGFDPRIAGIHYSLVPLGLPANADVLPRPSSEYGPKPGWYAVSVSLLLGSGGSIPDGSGGWEEVPEYSYVYLQNFRPVAKVGSTIYIFHIAATS